MFKRTIEDFTCVNCGFKVKGSGFTDHCPKCLASLHVDVEPGDRKAECRGLMNPISVEYLRSEFIINYKCNKCGFVRRVIAAHDDDRQKLESLFAFKKTSKQ
jgi:lipopolysaccharide biosynthesis regulator YciM